MKTTSKQNFAEVLKRRVLSMDIAPGELLDEVSLSQEFGISRTPLREVIQRLSGEGYLTLEANRGAKVASMDMSTLRHFFQAAPMIYASIARLAAEEATRDQVAKLKQLQKKFRASLDGDNVSETAMHNHWFHHAIGEMASSPYLMPSLNRLLIDHARIGQVFYHSRSPEDARRICAAADQHDAMIDAFTNHSPSKAVELTLEHWELSRVQMQKFVSPDPLPFNLESRTDAV